MHKIPLFLVSLLLPLHVFASNVDVSATPPSGTYHAPVHITLTPTDSRAKTFYSFKPDGYPQDAFLYTGSILLKHSSPVIYFSVVSTSNESKIKQNNYIITYPATVRFADDSVSGSGKVSIALINNGSESVDMGFWYVQSESDTVMIPEGTMIAPGKKYDVRLDYSGSSSIVLRSPDSEEKDILVHAGSPEKPEAIVPTKKTITVKTVPRKIISVAEIPIENSNVVPTENTNIPTMQTPPQTTSSITETTSDTPPSIRSETTEIQPPVPMDINQMVKVSANESGNTDTNPLYLVFFGAIAL